MQSRLLPVVAEPDVPIRYLEFTHAQRREEFGYLVTKADAYRPLSAFARVGKEACRGRRCFGGGS